MVSLQISAQTEVGSQRLSGTDADVQKIDVDRHLMADSMRVQTELMPPSVAAPNAPAVQSYTNLTKQGGTALPLWKGAYVGFYGMTDQKPSELRTVAVYSVGNGQQILDALAAHTLYTVWCGR